MVGGTSRTSGVAARVRALAAVFAILLASAAPGARATLPPAGWMPASQGLTPMAGADHSFAPPYIYPVTRIRPDPGMPGRMYAGHLFHGVFVYAGGVWTSLTPGCPLPRGNGERAHLIAASGLTACGVIDLALDPLDPKTIYVSAIDPQGTLASPQFEPGGVFRSTDAGLHWMRISKAFRAGGLGVSHLPGKPATIIAGYVQKNSGDPGTTTSLQVSSNDGGSWRGIAFKAPPGCPSKYVTVSPNLVATIGFHPTNPNIVYAGTNAGLYMSKTKGVSWSLALKACGKVNNIYFGGAWGLAFAKQGATVTVYSASWDGIIRKAVPGSTTWSTVTRVNGVLVRDLLVDVRNPRRLYAAVWGNWAKPGLYRIDGSTARLVEDNVLKDVAGRTGAVPRVYNLTKDAATLTIAQHPLVPDLVYSATILGGVFVRSEAP